MQAIKEVTADDSKLDNIIVTDERNTMRESTRNRYGNDSTLSHQKSRRSRFGVPKSLDEAISG